MGWFGKDSGSADRDAAPTADEILHKVRTFICQRVDYLKADEVDAEMALFSSGLLDSLAFLELVSFIESEFQLSLADRTEVTAERLDTISRISDILAR